MLLDLVSSLRSQLRIAEPDVTLTDYGLALETALFAYLLLRGGNRRSSLRTWFAVFFGSASVASLAGGTVHGLALEPEMVGHRILWSATLIAIGVTALSAWVIGSRIQFSPSVARRVWLAATLEFVGYCAVVLSVTQKLLVAIVDYLPAAVDLLVVFSSLYARSRERHALIGLGGLVLTFVAAGVQQGKVGIHPVYFDHNALYHLIQAVAFAMLFWSARRLVEYPEASKAGQERGIVASALGER